MYLPDLGLFWEADEDDNKMICDVGASIQRDGHAGGGALVQGAVCQGAQKKPGQLSDVGHALDEFFRPAKKIQFYRSYLSYHIRSLLSGLFTRS